MNEISAADLPAGSVIADDVNAWIKNFPQPGFAWSETSGDHLTDDVLDEYLAADARVLREGR